MAHPSSKTRGLLDDTNDRQVPAIVLLAIGLAAAGGLALRFWSPSPLWLDEALSVNIAQLPFTDMVEALRRDGHPAFYYLLLGCWIDLFGDSDFAVRSLSGVFSAATVPVIWTLGARLGRRGQHVALILAVFSPFLLRFGTEARMYALVVLLVSLGWLAVLRAVDNPSGLRLLAVALATAALAHTHYWSLWLIAAVTLILLRSAVRRDESSATARRVAAAVLIGGSTLVVWLGVLYDQATSTGTPWAGRARPAEVAIEVIQAIGGSHRFEGETLGVIFLVTALIGTFAVAASRGRIELGRPTDSFALGAAVTTALALVIGAVAALLTAGAYEPRYAAVVVPFILILVARGIAMAPVRIAATLTTVVILGGLAVGADEARRDRTQARDVAAMIDAAAHPDDMVIFCPDQVGPSTLRELKGDITSVAYPSGRGRFVDWTNYTERIDSLDPAAFAEQLDQQAGANAIWMVWGQNYRGLEGRCEAIIDTLATRRDTTAVVSPSTAFEAMALRRFEGRP